MKTTLEQLYKFDRYLLGAGFDNALKYIDHLIGLETIEIPSGTKLETWTVPDEWVVKDAWVKFNKEKIIDYQKNPMILMQGSENIHKIISAEELRNHLRYSDDKPDSIIYSYSLYEKDWGFNVPKNNIFEKILYDDAGNIICEGGTCTKELKDIDPTVGKIFIEGEEYKPKFKFKLEEGDYEVFIDTEYRPGTMKLGVHTIKGESDREILLFAHLDHPFQANDNLSGVVCLIDLAKRLKANHTIKIIFCPETIGSIAYTLTQDISRVDFMVSVDICGNDNSILLQKTFQYDRLNQVAHLAIHSMGKSFRKSPFRGEIGSDEYAFNDPLIGIPGIMISRFPYKEYHTPADTPEIINYEKIKETQDVIKKIIEIYEQDFIPKRNFKAPLMRSKYGIQSPSKQINLAWDYLFYSMDGKKYLSELCCDYSLSWDMVYPIVQKMLEDGSCSNNSKRKLKKTSKKKSS